MGVCASRNDVVLAESRRDVKKTPNAISRSQSLDREHSIAPAPAINLRDKANDNISTDDVWDDDAVCSPTPSSDKGRATAPTPPTTDSLNVNSASRRRRLSVSTVKTPNSDSTTAGDDSIVNGNGKAASKETDGEKKCEASASDDNVPDTQSRRRSTVKFEDPTLELVDQSCGSVKEVTLGMLRSLFPESEHYAVFGSPSYAIQRGYDNKAHEVDGVMPSGRSLKDIGVGYACKKGLKPESPNQDDFFVMRVDDWAIYGVFDGHGPSGHDISAFVHKTLPFLVIGDPAFETDLKTALKRAFLRVNELVGTISNQHDTDLDCSLSGTTGTLVVHRDNCLTVAHVGDSRGVLAKRDSGAKKFKAKDLTQDHKPTLTHERKRIEAHGGEVKRLDGDVPHRVFVKHRMYPGLAMSRAIGDVLAASVGVTAVPEISTIQLQPEDQFFVIATDGVWEFISSQEAIDLLGKKSSSKVNESAELLAYEAWRRWVAEEENVVDDVTCVVVWLNMNGEGIGPEHESTGTGGRRSSVPHKGAVGGGDKSRRADHRNNSVPPTEIDNTDG